MKPWFVVAAVAAAIAAGAIGAAVAYLPVLERAPAAATRLPWDEDVVTPLAIASLQHSRAVAYLRADPSRAALRAAAERASASVVRVQCCWEETVVEKDDTLENGMRTKTTSTISHTSRGSAIVVGPRTVLTARHVRELEPSKMFVVLADGTHVPATIAAEGADGDGEFSRDWLLLDVADGAPPLPPPLNLGTAKAGADVVVIGFGDDAGVGLDGRAVGNDEGPSGFPTWSVGTVALPLTMKIDVVAGGVTRGGASGGPVVNSIRDVVAVLVGNTEHNEYDWDESGVRGRETRRTYQLNAAPVAQAAKFLAARKKAPR